MSSGESNPRMLHASKSALFVAALVPMLWLVVDGFTDQLGASPVEEITHRTGAWALRFLLLTLAVTPLRRLTGWNVLARFRRMLGLFAFFYAAVHFAIYAVLDASLDLSYVLDDVLERPYITAGFATLCLLVPLALTSTNAMVRRLGGRRWRQLHRLAYAAAAGGVLHFFWQIKADFGEPLIYLLALLALLTLRLSPIAGRLSSIRWPLSRSPARAGREPATTR